MKQRFDFEVHTTSTPSKNTIVFVNAKSMSSALKKIKTYYGLENSTVKLIKLIDGFYARIMVAYNPNSKSWEGRAYYQGRSLTQSVKAFSEYDEERDCIQACNAFIKITMKEFNIPKSKVMTVTSNTGKEVRVGFFKIKGWRCLTLKRKL